MGIPPLPSTASHPYSTTWPLKASYLATSSASILTEIPRQQREEKSSLEAPIQPTTRVTSHTSTSLVKVTGNSRWMGLRSEAVPFAKVDVKPSPTPALLSSLGR